MKAKFIKLISAILFTSLTLWGQTNPGGVAYDAYLKGRYYFYQRRGDALRKGVQSFQHAIEKDPTYAAAYAGLADCLSLLGWWAFVPPEEGCGKAKELALKAIQRDPSLGEAHASLAWATVHYDYDFALAEREYRKCLSSALDMPQATNGSASTSPW